MDEREAERLGCSSTSSSSSSHRGGDNVIGRSFAPNLKDTRRPRERLLCPGGTDAGRRIGEDRAGEELIGEEGGSVPLENAGSYPYGYGC